MLKNTKTFVAECTSHSELTADKPNNLSFSLCDWHPPEIIQTLGQLGEQQTTM